MRKIDAHAHFVDFNQETDGFGSLLGAMDRAGVEKVVLFGLPVKKKWAYFEKFKPEYYLDGYSSCYYFTLTDEFVAHHYLQLEERDRRRFALLLCGFDPTDKSCVGYLEFMVKKYPFWKGIGELLLRHDELSMHTAGELPRINHPAMDSLFRFCADRRLPLLFHHNAQSVGYEAKAVYADEVREVLTKHPDATFIWAHGGASARTRWQESYWSLLEDLLSIHPNLHIDLSWKVYEQEMVSLGEPRDEYVSLLSKFPDRFMIGSDLTGHFSELPEEIGKYDPLFKCLTPDAAAKIGADNANRIYFGVS